jgi:hypothetical protein
MRQRLSGCQEAAESSFVSEGRQGLQNAAEVFCRTAMADEPKWVGMQPCLYLADIKICVTIEGVNSVCSYAGINMFVQCAVSKVMLMGLVEGVFDPHSLRQLQVHRNHLVDCVEES